jgi:hypothetical protein
MDKVKTYKRELATVMLAGLGVLVAMGDAAMVEIMVWPIVGFAAGAFGLDAVAKQWTK